MKQEIKTSSTKKPNNQKMSNKDQKSITECALNLRKIGDVVNLKYKLLGILARNNAAVLKKK
ncbi:phorbol-12-myristate-13-acetate-induced protein 1 [Acipenser oxyrinchus oxyrinchus]|uniref:Phorbol-12-myristate-13-acetate-induced protein 1 n=1 Tax=Acipenser oxyrinchus oxyrinchus TaxID=40147 RepID=A0AAD8GHI8_ACIOX|nr:phorbol-12-myristate-13-acetate-induced protein 1 [Acipenser oxyrinchus oxyrinchus]KAK1176475.1 phorbol-12-myristate-13-acetate-induced protein 1 [Acipenser oxyrinchus oxyrinchus]